MGRDVMQELTNKLNDILTDPPKYKKYQQDLTKYAWEQAQIFGYGAGGGGGHWGSFYRHSV